MKYFAARAFFTLLFIGICNAKSSVVGTVRASTNYGDVEGLIIDYNEGSRIHVFTGIPYAAPPIGQLRFKATEKPLPWNGTYNATFYRPPCYESGESSKIMDEDCLHLNIYAPAIGDVSGPPHPVLFWIHGGGYTGGSGNYDIGHFLAQKGVVMVTCNYRLQALGFLTTGDEVARGNFGMLDQQAALIWVKENIAAFRGDPDAITISGQSAGATSASLHLLSPKSMPIIKGAILQSGADQATWAMIEPEWTPSDYSRSLAEDLGCPTDDSARMVTCLRGLSAEEISRAADYVFADIKTGAIHIPWAPVVDGPGGFLPDTPENLRRKREFARVPVMTGSTSNEVGNFEIEENVTRSAFLDYLRTLVELVGQNNTDLQFDAINFQYTWWPDYNNGTINRKNLMDIVNDIIFNGPVDLTAKAHSEYNATYAYVFGYSSANNPAPAYKTVPHTAEVRFVLGYPFLDETTLNLTGKRLPYNYTDEDRSISDILMTMWSNFVKYRNPTPSPVEGVTWRPYSRTSLEFLSIEREWKHILNYRQHHYAFWTQLMIKLLGKNCQNEDNSVDLFQYEKVSEKYRNMTKRKYKKKVIRHNKARRVKRLLDILYSES